MKTIELLAGERQPGESARAVQACNDFLRQGPGRSLARLLRKYGKMRENAAPTTSEDTLSNWSRRFGWQARAEAFDAEVEELKNIQRQKELGTGLALDHKRVHDLKILALRLKRQIYARDDAGRMFNLWLRDVKWIGSGELGREVNVERFNSALVDQYRGALDDLARETGGRKQRVEQETFGPGGGPIPITIIEAVPPEQSPPEGPQQDESE